MPAQQEDWKAALTVVDSASEALYLGVSTVLGDRGLAFPAGDCALQNGSARRSIPGLSRAVREEDRRDPAPCHWWSVGSGYAR